MSLARCFEHYLKIRPISIALVSIIFSAISVIGEFFIHGGKESFWIYVDGPMFLTSALWVTIRSLLWHKFETDKARDKKRLTLNKFSNFHVLWRISVLSVLAFVAVDLGLERDLLHLNRFLMFFGFVFNLYFLACDDLSRVHKYINELTKKNPVQSL